MPPPRSESQAHAPAAADAQRAALDAALESLRRAAYELVVQHRGGRGAHAAPPLDAALKPSFVDRVATRLRIVAHRLLPHRRA